MLAVRKETQRPGMIERALRLSLEAVSSFEWCVSWEWNWCLTITRVKKRGNWNLHRREQKVKCIDCFDSNRKKTTKTQDSEFERAKTCHNGGDIDILHASNSRPSQRKSCVMNSRFDFIQRPYVFSRWICFYWHARNLIITLDAFYCRLYSIETYTNGKYCQYLCRSTTFIHVRK